MAYPRIGLGLTLVLVGVLWTGATAQSDCTNVIISLSPCLNYITGNSSSPTSGCCTQLGSVVRSRPDCLCQVLNGGGSSLGLQVNQTQAAALPATCNVKTPPLSSCNAAAPTGSPAGTTDSPNNVPSGGTGRGSNTTPSTDNGSSDGSTNRLAAPSLFFLLFAASYTFTL